MLKSRLVISISICLSLLSSVSGERPKDKPLRHPKGVFLPKRVPADPQAVAERIKQQSAALRYRGLQVKPSEEAEGSVLRFQWEICDALCQLDFVPEERLRRYEWLNEIPTTLIGWDATLEQVALEQGGVRVTIKVYPRLSDAGIASVNDALVEHYLYWDGIVEFLGTESNPGLRVITIN